VHVPIQILDSGGGDGGDSTATTRRGSASSGSGLGFRQVRVRPPWGAAVSQSDDPRVGDVEKRGDG
jgi:hypothetical protein